MKTTIYVDGFNLYYGNLKRRPYKWLDLAALFHRLLPSGHHLEKIKYFTARVKPLPGNPDAPKRQDVYLRTLRRQLGDRIEIFEGEFLVKNVRLPLTANPTQTVQVIKSEEKGSDVNLAVELVNDAWGGKFECAGVVSNDGDLAHALRIVKQTLKRRVLLFTPGAPQRTPLTSLSRWAHRQIDIREGDVAACQFPEQIPGSTLIRPQEW